MAILRSTSGKFYEIPDDQLSQYEVAADMVEQVAALAEEGGAAEGGEVDPYGFRIHLHFGGRRRRRRRPYWRNCWRNCY